MWRAIAPALALIAGCRTLGSEQGSERATAPPELRAVRFRIDDRVAVVAEGSVGAGFDDKLVSALRGELAGRGLTVVTGDSFDLLLHLETRVSGMAYTISGEATLQVERDGRAADQVSTGKLLHPDDQFAGEAARMLVGRLLRSPAVAELARLRAPAAPAPPPPADAATRARAHAQQGTAHYNLDQWNPALAEYQAAYMIFQDPALLFNIAQCHRKLGHRAEALDYFRKYLRNAPTASNRPEVEKRIEELEERPRPPARRRRR
jgi:hypothetical protein